MQFCRCLFLISIILMLQSCQVSHRMSPNFQWGRVNFKNGNYKTAFHQLLPVAASGNAEAQYAVGYMYYNGYGVSQDDESGIFWMEKAAEQGFCPAIKALELIRRRVTACPELAGRCDPSISSSYHAPPCLIRHGEDYRYHEFRHGVVIRRNEVSRHDEVLESIIKNQNESLTNFSKMSPVHFNNIPKKEISSNSYTLQLFGAYDLIDVKDFQAQKGLQKNTRVWLTKHDGQDWYILTYGRYETVAEAREAEEGLPDKIQDLKPWIRNIRGLKCP